MSGKDTTQDNRLLVLEKKVRDLQAELTAYKETVADRYQTKTAASTVQSSLSLLIDDVNTTLDEHTAKFATVSLPAETQYYLTKNQINGLRSSIAKITSLENQVTNTLQQLIGAWKSFKDAQNS